MLVGRNNAGKSAILQLIFRSLANDGSGEFGRDRVCFIPPDRQHVAATTQTGEQTLASWNAARLEEVGDVHAYEAPKGVGAEELSRVLLTNDDFTQQQSRVIEILQRLGLGRMRLGPLQAMMFDDVAVTLQGSGLRALLPIVAAMSDSTLRLIAIDEPELSLEASLQRALRELLIERAEAGCAVIVATHSHLFVPRDNRGAIFTVGRSDAGHARVAQVEERDELEDVIFRLLGDSTEDLVFPGNYVVVEGASEQTYVERALQLLGVPDGRVKVIAAGGVDGTRETVIAVERALRPLVAGDSPYRKTAVALLDLPPTDKAARVNELRDLLGDARCLVLDTPSIEEYVPAELYLAAGLDRAGVLQQLDAARGDYHAERRLRRDAARAVCASLTRDGLEQLPLIRDAATRAAELAGNTAPEPGASPSSPFTDGAGLARPPHGLPRPTT